MRPVDASSGGWEESARCWTEFVDAGDANRTLVLDRPMLALAGAVSGTEVLDVGCGEGRFCRMLAERGASTTGIDPTRELIETAKKRHPEGRYVQARAEALPFEDGQFETVVSYVTLCDIEGYREAIAEMCRVLAKGGRLLVAMHNPFVTTAPKGWRRDERGERDILPVDRYTFEWAARVSWKGIEIVNYHRPLSAYMNAFLQQGLTLTRLEEPLPSADDVAARPEIAEYLRIAYFLVMEWRKQ